MNLNVNIDPWLISQKIFGYFGWTHELIKLHQYGMHILFWRSYEVNWIFFFNNWYVVRDASGKVGSGIYGGNNVWFGSFSECKKIDESRFCLVFFDAILYLDKERIEVCIHGTLHWSSNVLKQCRLLIVIVEWFIFLSLIIFRVHNNPWHV